MARTGLRPDYQVHDSADAAGQLVATLAERLSEQRRFDEVTRRVLHRLLQEQFKVAAA